MIALSHRDKNYRHILNQCEKFTADGMPIVLLGKWSGKRLESRGNGTDLTQEILTQSSNRNIAILGGISPEKALERLDIAPSNNFFIETGRIDNDYFKNSAYQKLLKFKPHIIFLALGVPKQDNLAIKFIRDFPLSTIIGVGGAFDLLAGIKPRSPKWVQYMSMEWLHRLLTEPKRLWKRYLLRYPIALIYALQYFATKKSLHKSNRK